MRRKGWPLGHIAVIIALAGLIACVEAPAEQGPESEVVATVGERKITLEELDQKGLAANVTPYQQLYEARRAVLDQMLEQQLLGEEAEARGVSEEELISTEVDQKVTAVTDAEIEAFYNQNQNRMGGRPLDQMKERISAFLGSQRTAQLRKQLVDGLKQKADIRISLDPPRVSVEIADNDPATGPADAPVTIVEFSDFQCPYCQRVGPTMASVREAYGDKVRIVFRDYPLAFHQQAQPAAEAAQCAHEQGKFWEYHDKLFANQQALGADDLKKYAADLELDGERFTECFDSGRFRQDVQDDFQYGQSVGVSGTPAFFINGRFISGAQPFDKFKEIIDEELRTSS